MGDNFTGPWGILNFQLSLGGLAKWGERGGVKFPHVF